MEEEHEIWGGALGGGDLGLAAGESKPRRRRVLAVELAGHGGKGGRFPFEEGKDEEVERIWGR